MPTTAEYAGPPLSDTEKPQGDSSKAQGFSSVSVCCGAEACTTAKAMAGRRCLVKDAPSLPLPGCTIDTCNCRYFTYGDRRSFLTNRRTQGKSRNWLWQGNRRVGQERRKLKIDFTRWL